MTTPTTPHLPDPPLPVSPLLRTAVVAAFLALASAVLWWLSLLAAYLLDRASEAGSEPNELIVTALYLLPWVAIASAIVALQRLKGPDTSAGRPKLAKIAAWIGLLLGGVGPFLLIAYAMSEGM